MTGSTLVKLVVAGIFFALWPLLMKKSGLEPPAQCFLFAMGGVLILMPWSVMQSAGKTHDSILFFSDGMLIGMTAAAVNSFGIMVYLKSLGALTPQKTGTGVLITLIALTLTNEVVSVLLLGAPITLKKAFGVLSAIAAFVFLV